MAHTEIAKAIYEAFNDRDWAAATMRAADDISVTIVPFGMTTTGKDGFAEFMKSWVTMSSDVKVELEYTHSGPNHVVNEIVGTGTHDGPLMTPTGEIPATGKRFELRSAEVWELRDGKLSVLRNYPDALGLLTQLGVIGG